ncbi:MAG: peptide deformylase [Planctomycetota bacterium]|nr:peptide deformylase [Planctomycetota bacterium]
MYEDLKIILYPDPRLKRLSKPVEKFDDRLASLAGRMFELMREHRGVGLAAPQVGHNIRMFIISPTGKPEDEKVYVNPVLLDADGEEISQEGCLSIPGVSVDIPRAKTVKLEAQDLTGKPIEQTDAGYIPRIWQHEFDHLNGTMIIDRMGPTAKMEHRKTLRELEETYNAGRDSHSKAK